MLCQDSTEGVQPKTATHLFATDDLPAGPPSADTDPVNRPGGVQALACQEMGPREHHPAESRSIGRAAVLAGALLQALPHSLLHLRPLQVFDAK